MKGYSSLPAVVHAVWRVRILRCIQLYQYTLFVVLSQNTLKWATHVYRNGTYNYPRQEVEHSCKFTVYLQYRPICWRKNQSAWTKVQLVVPEALVHADCKLAYIPYNVCPYPHSLDVRALSWCLVWLSWQCRKQHRPCPDDELLPVSQQPSHLKLYKVSEFSSFVARNFTAQSFKPVHHHKYLDVYHSTCNFILLILAIILYLVEQTLPHSLRMVGLPPAVEAGQRSLQRLPYLHRGELCVTTTEVSSF